MRTIARLLITAIFLSLPSVAVTADTISICSFNIQFLGSFKSRDDSALAEVVKGYDIVVVQELVAPPKNGTYPDNNTYEKDAEAAEFFDEMETRGFKYILSEEDTGSSKKIHKATTATEWWVVFYKPDVIEVDNDLPHGFLGKMHGDHPNFERVPYAFGLKAKEGNLDFVLISVHLKPEDTKTDKMTDPIRRMHELDTIARWVELNDSVEKDFIILGDMNIEDCKELAEATPDGYVSLNSSCLPTNTLPGNNKQKPYDHVMYRPAHTQFDIDSSFPFTVVDLVEEVRSSWNVATMGPFPGDPYDHNIFKQHFSDHRPVVFQMLIGNDDD